MVNVAITLAWIAVAFVVLRRHRDLTERQAAAA
jgi:hypothetical protein